MSLAAFACGITCFSDGETTEQPGKKGLLGHVPATCLLANFNAESHRCVATPFGPMGKQHG